MRVLLILPLVVLADAQYNVPAELYSPLIAQKVLKTAQGFRDPAAYPQWTTLPPYGSGEGTWQLFPADTWTSGFLPSSLMLLNERGRLCPNGELISAADTSTSLSQGRRWAAPLVSLEQQNNVRHDVGFVSFPFWEELKIDPNNSTAQGHINAFAKYLAGRYSPVVGCTKSWDSSVASDFTVIIDNMVNLELLFISADLTGNQSYRDMAMSHADHTIANHIRPDGSTFHVVIYDSGTGAVKTQQTHQGYADSSTWSRGQAWGMYGFISVYNRTRQQRYLDTARRLSQYYVSRLPSDHGVPPWDFDAPSTPMTPRDTSSATIATSAMLFLAQMERSIGNDTGADLWIQHSVKLLTNTIALAWRIQPQWEALLSNGTANNPNRNYNTGLVYGDYYFIKAGNMLLSMGITQCTPSRAASSSGSPAGSNLTSRPAGSSSASLIGQDPYQNLAIGFFWAALAAMFLLST